jgi:hypothetical protein
MQRMLAPLVIAGLIMGAQGSFAASSERLAVNAEALVNTFDGSARKECALQDEIEANKAQEIWITFGSVKPQEKQDWEVTSSTTRCGSGSFAKARTLLGRTLGFPYLIVDLKSILTVSSAAKVGLQTTLEIQKLSAFDKGRHPVYTRSQQQRKFFLAPEEYGVVPLLLADPHERDLFNIYELFLQLSAKSLRQGTAAYGALAVTADVPGVDILLDGGVLGRTQEEGSTLLKNMLVGTHEVRVHDFSGHSISKQISIEKGKTTEAALNLLNLPSRRSYSYREESPGV